MSIMHSISIWFICAVKGILIVCLPISSLLALRIGCSIGASLSTQVHRREEAAKVRQGGWGEVRIQAFAI